MDGLEAGANSGGGGGRTNGSEGWVGGRGLYDGAGGWGGGQGGPGSGRRFAGRKGLRAGDSAGDRVGAGQYGRTTQTESLSSPARVMVASGQGASVARRTQCSTLVDSASPTSYPRSRHSYSPERRADSFVFIVPMRSQWFYLPGRGLTGREDWGG